MFHLSRLPENSAAVENSMDASALQLVGGWAAALVPGYCTLLVAHNQPVDWRGLVD